MLAQKRSRTSWVPRQRCLAAVYTAALAKGGARGGRRAGWTRRRLAYNISLKTELLLPAYISRLVPACTSAPSSAHLPPSPSTLSSLVPMTTVLHAPGYPWLPPSCPPPIFLPVPPPFRFHPLLPWYVWPYPPMHAGFFGANLEILPILPSQTISHNLHEMFKMSTRTSMST